MAPPHLDSIPTPRHTAPHCVAPCAQALAVFPIGTAVPLRTNVGEVLGKVYNFHDGKFYVVFSVRNTVRTYKYTMAGLRARMAEHKAKRHSQQVHCAHLLLHFLSFIPAPHCPTPYIACMLTGHMSPTGLARAPCRP